MYDNLLFRSNQVMALFPGLIGLNLLIRPEATLEQIKFTIPSEPQARKLTRGLARIYGIRNVVITFLFTNLCLTKDPGMVNLGYMGALAMCLTDGYVAKSVIGHGEWSHWVFAPVCVGAIAANYYFVLHGVFNNHAYNCQFNKDLVSAIGYAALINQE